MRSLAAWRRFCLWILCGVTWFCGLSIIVFGGGVGALFADLGRWPLFLTEPPGQRLLTGVGLFCISLIAMNLLQAATARATD